MKSTIFIIITSILSIQMSYSQTKLKSESDVFLFLNSNRFKNTTVDVETSFTNMGGYLHVNGVMKAYNPRIFTRKSKIYIKYYMLNNPNKTLTFEVDGYNEKLIDIQNRREYYVVK
jgi:hypothetical protein